MTPDELRRMDNDLCIIYEKGIRPIKAEKFYYFQTAMARKLTNYAINHNDVGEINRGEWRKYNPYNPYVPEEDKKKQVDNLKVESLDDLFDEPEPKKEEPKIEPIKEIKLETTKMDEAPILPTGDNDLDDELDKDLQKELEAKFDELFGPLDDND